MSGDVQPRKRKDKKKKKDDLGVEEPRGTAAALGEGDVFMHSYHDHGTGGHWCAKIIFFSLLAVLVTLIGLIILENRGLTELEANSVESRYSGVLEGWIEDAIDDHHDEHTLELKHHDDDEDHPDDQLDENEAEEESLEEEIDHNENDESNEEEIEDDKTHKEDDEEEDELQNDEDELDDDDDGYDDENHSDDDDDEEDEPDSNVDEVHDEDNDNEDNGKYEEEIEERLKDDEDDEETYEQYSYEEMMKSKNDIVENGDENDDDEDEEEKKHDLSKEMTSHYNYYESYENGDDESKEMKYDDENESNEQNTEDEANEEDDQEDVDENEEEIEKIEKEIYDDSEEIVDNDAFASKEKRDASKEVTEEDTSKEDDEPAVEKLSRPKGKPFVEIEEETPVKPVDTLAEEEAYEREQEELRRQEEQAPHSKGGGNSLEADWPGEPSDPYWRSQLDTAEEEFRQGSWSSAAARAGGGGLAACGRARWLRARALDRAAEQSRDNRVLAEAIAAYLHLLKMNEAMSDEKLLEVARRTVDRIQFRGTYLSAEPVYRLLIRRFPDDVNFRNNLTITYLMANRADLADEVLKETLRLWPNDRVALAHHGFVLKIHHNKLEEAVRVLRKALDGEAGRANEPRFHYHLGDALLMLGRFDEAHEVHRRGAELGHFLSPSQRSLYNVPRLRGRPWWRIEDTPYLGLARALEASWRDILKEGEAAVALYEQEKEGLKERGEWSQLDIFVRGREVGGRCARAPALCAALRGAGPAAACARGQVKFSLMAPGTHVRPHVGPTNCRLRMHLALSNTEGTYLRVDKETRQWQVGKTLLFDDSFEHEVWHNGTGSRLVLIVDVWHPDLTAAERRQLPAI